MKVHVARSLTACGLVLMALWLGSSVYASSKARIDGLEAKVEGQRLLVSCRLVDAFDESFQERLKSGLPTPLVYRFVLERDRRSWFDQSVDRSRLQVVAMFNAVTSEYLINFKHDGDLVESRVIRDLDELRRAMTELVDFPVFDLEGRNTEAEHRLRVRAELGTRTVLALIPRTLATDWARTERQLLDGS